MSQFVFGNHITLLCNGTAYFPALLAALQTAKQEVYLQTYIFELDQTGVQVANALQQAAQRGVAVFLLLDGFGCRRLPKHALADLKAAGVHVLFFRPKISPWTLKRSRLRRLHSKLVVVDGQTAFVGGINIIDDFNTPAHIPPRIDYAAQVQGPLLAPMHTYAKLVWRRACRRQFVKPPRDIVMSQAKLAGEMQAAFVIRNNIRHRRDIENTYLSAIESAQSDVMIANAYFLPGLRFRHALKDAATRGVKVTLLLQKHTEYRLLDFATRALYGALLKQGVCIYEYHKSFMHSKVATVDNRLAIVGSSNIDPFSLLLSLEANIVVQNRVFASELQQCLLQSIHEGANIITMRTWHQQHIGKRILSWLAYGVVKVMVGMTGYAERN